MVTEVQSSVHSDTTFRSNYSKRTGTSETPLNSSRVSVHVCSSVNEARKMSSANRALFRVNEAFTLKQTRLCSGVKQKKKNQQRFLKPTVRLEVGPWSWLYSMSRSSNSTRFSGRSMTIGESECRADTPSVKAQCHRRRASIPMAAGFQYPRMPLISRRGLNLKVEGLLRSSILGKTRSEIREHNACRESDHS